MARRFRRRGSFRGKPRRTTWEEIPGLTTTAMASDTTGFGSGSLAFLENGYSVRRLIGSLWVTFSVDDVISLGDEFLFGIGLAKLSADAVALGATSFPDPLAEPEYPWLLRKTFTLYTDKAEADANLAGGWGLQAQQWEFDSRVMRNVSAGEALVWVAQNAAIVGAPLVHFSMEGTRVLLAMP